MKTNQSKRQQWRVVDTQTGLVVKRSVSRDKLATLANLLSIQSGYKHIVQGVKNGQIN